MRGKKSLITFKLIYHLSYPVGEIVNDSIDSLWCLVLYTTFKQREAEYGICFPFVIDALKLSLFIPIDIDFKREFQKGFR